MNTSFDSGNHNDIAFIRLREVRRITGLSASTIYARSARGEFPQQVKIGAQSVAWLKSEVMEWCRNMLEQRSTPPQQEPVKQVA